ncbi:sugar kinase [Enterococcus ratti]|uniref:PfkB family carbohydrate kinase n=1 Tax=Enterococcus ratti TaxID=150033 RepID=UPI0035159E98
MGKIVTLGEIMLRLSTKQGTRIDASEQFSAHYGGGEANVAISLANYGHQTVFATKVPNNALGKAVKKHLQCYGVDTQQVLLGGPRLGTYYVEAGVGKRAVSVIYDRAGSSFSQMDHLEWSLAALFKDADVFHISGITPALSKNWAHMTKQVMEVAKEAGCLISFDVNYRGKLWAQQEASKVVTQLLPLVDICSAGKMDALHLLGIKEAPPSEKQSLIYYYQEMQKKFPNIQVFYSTNRMVRSASTNELTGTLWMNHEYKESCLHEITSIVDRVGGGDAFAGGVLHGLLTGKAPQEIIDFATAASVLKHTVYGDCNQFSEEEVAQFLACGSGKIIR